MLLAQFASRPLLQNFLLEAEVRVRGGEALLEMWEGRGRNIAYVE